MGWIEALKGTRSQQLYRWLVGGTKATLVRRVPAMRRKFSAMERALLWFWQSPFYQRGVAIQLVRLLPPTGQVSSCIPSRATHPPAERVARLDSV